MSDTNDPLAWVKHAEEDYLLALSALHRKKPLTFGACFHTQQCAEKYLKAMLVAKGISFPKTHDLLLLDGLCQKSGILVGIEAKQLNTLSDCAVRARYPGDEPMPEEARESLEIAKTVRRFARRWLEALHEEK
jgi:HEPN domain-containing protein